MAEAPHGGPMRVRRRHAVFFLKLSLSLGLLWFMLSRANLSSVWGSMRQADLGYLGLALLTPLVGYYLTSLRWGGLILAAGHRVSQRPLFCASVYATYFNQLLPSTIGGDVSRVYEAWRAGVPKSIGLSSIFVDRITGVLALSLLAAVTLPLIDRYPGRPDVIYALVLGASVCLIVGIGMVFVPSSRVLRTLRAGYAVLPAPARKVFVKLDGAMDGYRGRVGVFGRAIALSLVLQFNVVLMHWLLAGALGLDVTFIELLFVVPLALMVMLVPVTINGIGIREGIFAVLLASYGITEPDAVALALLSYGVFLFHGAIGGVLFGLRRGRRPQRPESLPEALLSETPPQPTRRGVSPKRPREPRGLGQTAQAGTLRSPTDTR